LEAFNEKNKEKNHLVATLTEVWYSLLNICVMTSFPITKVTIFYLFPWLQFFILLIDAGWEWKNKDEETGGAMQDHRVCVTKTIISDSVCYIY